MWSEFGKGWFYFYSTIGYVSIAFVQNIVPNVALDIVGKKEEYFKVPVVHIT